MRRISDAEKELKHKTEGKSGVYRLTTPDGECYVGSSENIWRRWLGHKTYLRAGRHRSKSLQKSFCERGFDALTLEVLLLCDTKDLLFYEQRAMDVIRPVHNTSLTAGSTKGVVASEDTRAKLSAAKIGKKRPPLSAEARAKISAKAKERYLSPEYREKSAASMRGIPKSAEHRAKLSAFNTGKTLSLEHRETIGASGRAARSKASNGG